MFKLRLKYGYEVIEGDWDVLGIWNMLSGICKTY